MGTDIIAYLFDYRIYRFNLYQRNSLQKFRIERLNKTLMIK